jgi:hypothetical protein
MDAKLPRKTNIDLNRLKILSNALKRNKNSFIQQDSIFLDPPQI